MYQMMKDDGSVHAEDVLKMIESVRFCRDSNLCLFIIKPLLLP